MFPFNQILLNNIDISKDNLEKLCQIWKISRLSTSRLDI